MIVWTRCATDLPSEVSLAIHEADAPASNFLSAACARFSLRLVTTTVAPSRAKPWAAASPIPLVPPVTRATLPFISG